MKRIATYIPTALVVIGITYVSLLREPSFSLPKITGADKFAHIAMFALLSCVFAFDSWRDWTKRKEQKGKSFYILHSTLYITFALYGGIIEILQQQFFYPRTGSWGDWLADIIGCAIGFIFSLILWYQTSKN